MKINNLFLLSLLITATYCFAASDDPRNYTDDYFNIDTDQEHTHPLFGGELPASPTNPTQTQLPLNIYLDMLAAQTIPTNNTALLPDQSNPAAAALTLTFATCEQPFYSLHNDISCNLTQPAISAQNQQSINPLLQAVEQARREEKSKICTFCGKERPSNAHRIIHERIHTDEKPYKCNHAEDNGKICDRTFSDNSNLIKHKRRHYDLRSFRCNICNKGFNNPDCLKSHQKGKTHLKKASKNNGDQDDHS